MNNFNERTKLAMELAKIAGKEIKRIREEEDINVREKGTNDVVTVADYQSEKLIINRIMEVFPDDTIISEEVGKYHEGTSGYSWAIDPVDGTLNYSRGMPHYCVSVGYMKEGIPYGGAIYIPELNELYYGEKNMGSFCNEKRLKVSMTASLDKSIALMDFTNRNEELSEFFNNTYSSCMNNMVNVLKIFSGATSLCYIASGKIDAYIGGYGYIWDFCVGYVLITEAGGICSSINNKEIDFTRIDKYIVLAANKNIYNEFSNIVNKNL